MKPDTFKPGSSVWYLSQGRVIGTVVQNVAYNPVTMECLIYILECNDLGVPKMFSLDQSEFFPTFQQANEVAYGSEHMAAETL